MATRPPFTERKALGGFAAVCVGDCIVDIQTGRHYPFLCDMKDPNTLPGLSAVASAISRHGAVASAELSHAGMYAPGFPRPDRQALMALCPWRENTVRWRRCPREVIHSLIRDFGAAAAWAKRCGFGMVTIHGGHRLAPGPILLTSGKYPSRPLGGLFGKPSAPASGGGRQCPPGSRSQFPHRIPLQRLRVHLHGL